MHTGNQHPQEDLHALEQRSLRLAEELRTRLSIARKACRELGQRAGTLAGEPDAALPRLEDIATSPRETPPLTDRAERRVEVLEAARKGLARELSAAQEGLARAETERHELLSQQARLSESVRQAEHQLREAAAVASKEFEVRLQAEQQTQETLREELAQLTAQLAGKQEQQSRLEQQVEALEATAQRVQTAFREQQTREQEMRVELDRVRERLAATEQKDRAAQGEKQALVVKSASLRQELDNARRGNLEQIASLEQRIGEIESERDAAHQQVENLESLLLEPASGPQAPGDVQPEAAPHPPASRLIPDDRARGEKRTWTTLAAGVVLGILAGATASWLVQKHTLQLAAPGGTAQVPTAQQSARGFARDVERDRAAVPAVAAFPQSAPAAVPGPYRLPRSGQRD